MGRRPSMWSSIVPPSRVYKAGGRRRLHTVAAPFAPNHSVDPLPPRPDSPFQRRLQFDARQLSCQCNVIMKALPIQGARLIDAWRTLQPRERQSVALILCMLGWGALYGQPKAAVRTAVTTGSRRAGTGEAVRRHRGGGAQAPWRRCAGTGEAVRRHRGVVWHVLSMYSRV